MPRNELWWDTKLSNGKTPKQIVISLRKDLLFSERDVDRILTRLLVLQDKQFFKKGQSTTAAILICTYLCLNEWKIGRKPISPWKFSMVCSRYNFRVSYSVLMKGVRNAKEARYFKKGMSPKEIIERYRNQMILVFHFSAKFLDEVENIVSQKEIGPIVGGTSPFVTSAGIVYYHSKKWGLLTTQGEVGTFFGVSHVSIRCFHEHYVELIGKINKNM